MAQERKSKPAPEKKPETKVDDKKFRGFANIDLTDANKEWVKAHMDDLSLVNDYETELVTNGFKVTVSFDYESDCFVASATGTDRIPLSAGVAVSARSLDKEASKLALYSKIAHVAEWNLEQFVKSTKRPLDV